MSNIEEDIKTMHKIISFYKDLDIINDNGKCKEIKAIEHILAEREQDKKIIKELEEQVKILDEAYTGVIKESKKWFDIAHSSIPKQKVKDKIEEINKEYEDSKDKNGNSEYYYPDYTIRKFKELLEEK